MAKPGIALLLCFGLVLGVVGCSDDTPAGDAAPAVDAAPDQRSDAGGVDRGRSDTVGHDVGVDGVEPQVDSTQPQPDAISGNFRVMTFNIGTTKGLQHDIGLDPYTSKEAKIADELYENSLSWNPAEQALTTYLARERPDIVVFQEGYYDPWCESIAVDPNLDFVCKGYSKTRPLQVQRLLGPDYQVATAQGQEDNAIAVKRSFGSLVGCDPAKACIDGLEGDGPPSGCSNGGRIASIEVELSDKRRITVVLVHGSSGAKGKDIDCRADQFKQIFEDRGDGRPAANGTNNLVMGDLNTDPFLLGGLLDKSAQVWNAHVGPGRAFHYISSGPAGGPGTYAGLLRIDHVASDTIVGSCLVPGASPNVPPVFDTIYWDHNPVLCDVRLP